MPPLKISDASFQNDVLNASKPVRRRFLGGMVQPCRMIAPALEELSAELQDKVTVCQAQHRRESRTPQKYGVRGVPTLIFFTKGQVAATKVGALPKSKIKEWIEASIS